MNSANISSDEQVMAEIIGIPIEGTRSLGNEKEYENFLKICGKLDDMNIRNMSKKALKGEF